MDNLFDSFAPPTTRTRLVKSRMPWYNDASYPSSSPTSPPSRKKMVKSRSGDDLEFYHTAKKKEIYFKEKLSTCNTRDVYLHEFNV